MKLRKVVISSILMASQLAFSAPLKKAILVVPGSFVKADAYDSLIEEIEISAGQSFLIEKTSFLGDFPTRTGVIASLKSLKSRIESEGFEADITVLAHSQGGLSASGLTKDLASRVVRLASYQRSDWFKKQKKEMIPTLTIGGMLDNLTSAERILFEGEQVQSDPLAEVALLRGVNHFQFADGRTDSRDNVSTISTEAAHVMIAKFVSAFMGEGLESLSADRDYLYSKQIIEGYINAKKVDENLCETAQYDHLGSAGNRDDLKVNLRSYKSQLNYPQFILDKSKITALENGQFEIDVYQYAENPASPIDIKYLKNVNPKVIGCKLRSADDVARALGTKANPVSCLDVNLKHLRKTAAMLPNAEKERLSDFLDLGFSDVKVSDENVTVATGMGFSISDTIKERGDQWALLSIFKSRNESKLLKIETDSVTTPLGNPSNPFYGAHYCKIIPASRAYTMLINLK